VCTWGGGCPRWSPVSSVHTGRYIARPPIAADLPEELPDGRWCIPTPADPRTGATEVVLDPLELMHRIACQIPDPGMHMVRYYGAYSCRGRRARAPGDAASEEGEEPCVPAADDPHARERRRSWARLMRRILEVDPLECPRCGEAMEIIAFITEPDTIDHILRHLARARDPPQDEDPTPDAP
jgi:hypothetical protein